MIATTALRSLSSRSAILFLVTSYLEALPHMYAAEDLPPAATQLPLLDEADLYVRLKALQRADVTTVGARAAVRQTAAVFSSALQRLVDVQEEISSRTRR